jgi:hypothetical protein
MFADENIGVTDQNGNAGFRFWAQITQAAERELPPVVSAEFFCSSFRHFFGWYYVLHSNSGVQSSRSQECHLD